MLVICRVLAFPYNHRVRIDLVCGGFALASVARANYSHHSTGANNHAPVVIDADRPA